MLGDTVGSVFRTQSTPETAWPPEHSAVTSCHPIWFALSGTVVSCSTREVQQSSKQRMTILKNQHRIIMYIFNFVYI